MDNLSLDLMCVLHLDITVVLFYLRRDRSSALSGLKA